MLEAFSYAYQHTPWFLAVHREDDRQDDGCGGMHLTTSSGEATWHVEEAGAMFNTIFQAPPKEDTHEAAGLRFAAPVPPNRSEHGTTNASRPRPRSHSRPGRMLRVVSGVTSTVQRWRRGRPEAALTEQAALPCDAHAQIVTAPPSTARVRWEAVAIAGAPDRHDEASALPDPGQQQALAFALAGRIPSSDSGGPAVVHLGEPEGGGGGFVPGGWRGGGGGGGGGLCYCGSERGRQGRATPTSPAQGRRALRRRRSRMRGHHGTWPTCSRSCR